LYTVKKTHCDYRKNEFSLFDITDLVRTYEIIVNIELQNM